MIKELVERVIRVVTRTVIFELSALNNDKCTRLDSSNALGGPMFFKRTILRGGGVTYVLIQCSSVGTSILRNILEPGRPPGCK